MRVNLFCCFKSPTTDDDSSQSSSRSSRSASPKSKRDSVYISAPIVAPVRPPVQALGADVRVVPVPEINIVRTKSISRPLPLSPLDLSPAISPAPSRAEYVNPAEIEGRVGVAQEAAIKARVQLMFASCEALLEQRDSPEEPPYLQVVSGRATPYEDPYEELDGLDATAEDPYEEMRLRIPADDNRSYVTINFDETPLGERLPPIGASNPSIFQPNDDADVASVSGRSQATALTPPPSRRISAADVLGVPDDYGLGASQFGESGSYPIG